MKQEPNVNKIAYTKMAVTFAMKQLGCKTEDELIEMCNSLVDGVKYLYGMNIEL